MAVLDPRLSSCRCDLESSALGPEGVSKAWELITTEVPTEASSESLNAIIHDCRILLANVKVGIKSANMDLEACLKQQQEHHQLIADTKREIVLEEQRLRRVELGLEGEELGGQHEVTKAAAAVVMAEQHVAELTAIVEGAAMDARDDPEQLDMMSCNQQQSQIGQNTPAGELSSTREQLRKAEAELERLRGVLWLIREEARKDEEAREQAEARRQEVLHDQAERLESCKQKETRLERLVLGLKLLHDYLHKRVEEAEGFHFAALEREDIRSILPVSTGKPKLDLDIVHAVNGMDRLEEGMNRIQKAREVLSDVGAELIKAEGDQVDSVAVVLRLEGSLQAITGGTEGRQHRLVQFEQARARKLLKGIRRQQHPHLTHEEDGGSDEGGELQGGELLRGGGDDSGSESWGATLSAAGPGMLDDPGVEKLEHMLEAQQSKCRLLQHKLAGLGAGVDLGQSHLLDHVEMEERSLLRDRLAAAQEGLKLYSEALARQRGLMPRHGAVTGIKLGLAMEEVELQKVEEEARHADATVADQVLNHEACYNAWESLLDKVAAEPETLEALNAQLKLAGKAKAKAGKALLKAEEQQKIARSRLTQQQDRVARMKATQGRKHHLQEAEVSLATRHINEVVAQYPPPVAERPSLEFDSGTDSDEDSGAESVTTLSSDGSSASLDGARLQDLISMQEEKAAHLGRRISLMKARMGRGSADVATKAQQMEATQLREKLVAAEAGLEILNHAAAKATAGNARGRAGAITGAPLASAVLSLELEKARKVAADGAKGIALLCERHSMAACDLEGHQMNALGGGLDAKQASSLLRDSALIKEIQAKQVAESHAKAKRSSKEALRQQFGAYAKASVLFLQQNYLLAEQIMPVFGIPMRSPRSPLARPSFPAQCSHCLQLRAGASIKAGRGRKSWDKAPMHEPIHLHQNILLGAKVALAGGIALPEVSMKGLTLEQRRERQRREEAALLAAEMRRRRKRSRRIKKQIRSAKRRAMQEKKAQTITAQTRLADKFAMLEKTMDTSDLYEPEHVDALYQSMVAQPSLKPVRLHATSKWGQATKAKGELPRVEIGELAQRRVNAYSEFGP
ncbi:unnamed protein product [Chrysoparadoxa australica]